MSYTKKFTVTQGAWVRVIGGQDGGYIQCIDAGPVLVYAGPTANPPAVDSLDAISLHHGGVRIIHFDSMDPVDSVWVRSLHDESNDICAHSTGSPIA